MKRRASLLPVHSCTPAGGSAEGLGSAALAAALTLYAAFNACGAW